MLCTCKAAFSWLCPLGDGDSDAELGATFTEDEASCSLSEETLGQNAAEAMG